MNNLPEIEKIYSCPHRDSNPGLWIGAPLLYQLSYENSWQTVINPGIDAYGVISVRLSHSLAGRAMECQSIGPGSNPGEGRNRFFGTCLLDRRLYFSCLLSRRP